MRILFSFFAVITLVLSAYAGVKIANPSIPFWSCHPLYCNRNIYSGVHLPRAEMGKLSCAVPHTYNLRTTGIPAMDKTE